MLHKVNINQLQCNFDIGKWIFVHSSYCINSLINLIQVNQIVECEIDAWKGHSLWSSLKYIFLEIEQQIFAFDRIYFCWIKFRRHFYFVSHIFSTFFFKRRWLKFKGWSSTRMSKRLQRIFLKTKNELTRVVRDSTRTNLV